MAFEIIIVDPIASQRLYVRHRGSNKRVELRFEGDASGASTCTNWILPESSVHQLHVALGCILEVMNYSSTDHEK